MTKNKKGRQKPTMKEIAALAAATTLGPTGEPLITSPDKPASKDKPSREMSIGDWVRCFRGPLRGAEGSVFGVKKISELVTVLEVRQLNGNTIKLPRAHWEFAAFRSSEAHAE